MASLDDLLAQLGLAAPLVQPPPAPVVPTTFTPYDTSVAPGTAFGTPYPGLGGFPTPTDTGATDTSMRDTGTTAAPGGFGYTPQPRQPLPRPLVKGPGSDMFAGYRDLYNPPAQDTDPVAALLSSLGQGTPQTPPSRALTPPWMTRQTGPQYGAQARPMGGRPTDALSEGERTLLRQSPAYARAISRIRALDRMRSQRGML
jgi:hypothetical protein